MSGQPTIDRFPSFAPLVTRLRDDFQCGERGFVVFDVCSFHLPALTNATLALAP